MTRSSQLLYVSALTVIIMTTVMTMENCNAQWVMPSNAGIRSLTYQLESQSGYVSFTVLKCPSYSGPISSAVTLQTPSEKLTLDLQNPFGELCVSELAFYLISSDGNSVQFTFNPSIVSQSRCSVALDSLPARCSMYLNNDPLQISVANVTIVQVDRCPQSSTLCGPSCCPVDSFCSDASTGSCCAITGTYCCTCDTNLTSK